MSSDQILITVENDELQTRQKEDNGICNKEDVFENEIQFVNVNQEFLTSDDNADIEFYLEYDKNIKCEPNVSDVFISSVEDIVHDDSKYSTGSSENNLTNPEANKVTEKTNVNQTQKYQCAICNREYLHKISLEYHLKAHLGIKDFRCSICEKCFVTKTERMKHEKIHTGNKNYECSICKKKFKHKSNLNQHKNIHTGIKNYECLICRDKFYLKSALKKHEKRHTSIENYECPICKKKFVDKYTLTEHEKIHTGIKNFECLVCKKRFIRKSALIRHENIHTNVKIFGVNTTVSVDKS